MGIQPKEHHCIRHIKKALRLMTDWKAHGRLGNMKKRICGCCPKGWDAGKHRYTDSDTRLCHKDHVPPICTGAVKRIGEGKERIGFPACIWKRDFFIGAGYTVMKSQQKSQSRFSCWFFCAAWRLDGSTHLVNAMNSLFNIFFPLFNNVKRVIWETPCSHCASHNAFKIIEYFVTWKAGGWVL